MAKKVNISNLLKKILKGFISQKVQAMINAFFNNYIGIRIAMLVDCGLRAVEFRTLKASNVKETIILVNGKENSLYFSSLEENFN
ncbi:MAG TPA: hypothetical protein VEY51_11560 [Chondromyces sp.]|nr:hypothetical protein [Chondromyces sp.]